MRKVRLFALDLREKSYICISENETMNMRRVFFLIAVAMAAVACNRSGIKIEGRLIGCDTVTVYVEALSPSMRSRTVDSVRTDDLGRFSLKLRADNEPITLYNLNCRGERIPLLLTAGDRVTVNSVGSLSRNYEVEGSEESALLKRISFIMQDGVYRLDSIANNFSNPALDEQQRREVLKDYTQEYYRIKRAQIAFIIENSASMAALYALYQRLPNDDVLFNGQTDVVYYRTVADTLSQRYPNSSYIASLRRDIETMDLVGAAVASQNSFPELNLPDMFGNKVSLAALEGKVILLEFWSATVGNSNAMNAELKELYSKYADRGFEIYQVGIESSKAAWINAVQEQNLPWISVSDLAGAASPALGMYNVRSLPANFLIDRNGDIVARDIYGAALEGKVAELLQQ